MKWIPEYCPRSTDGLQTAPAKRPYTPHPQVQKICRWPGTGNLRRTGQLRRACLFWATADLAYKQIFPSLQRLGKRDKLNIPVIGVANPAGTSISSNSAPGEVSKSIAASIPSAFDKLMLYFRFANSFLEPISTRHHIQSVEITMAEQFGI